tara:strand:- start:609 stop:794 length:186 start_codon:yes stop_codon:yes gene_type:complete
MKLGNIRITDSQSTTDQASFLMVLEDVFPIWRQTAVCNMERLETKDVRKGIDEVYHKAKPG